MTTYLVIGAIVALLVVFVLISYVKAPPAIAYIISGLCKEPRVLIGKGGFRVPFLERLDKVQLGQISVDIKTEIPVPTKDFINVDVDAIAKIRVMPTSEGIRLAAKNFLNMDINRIAQELQDSLQGNMREIIGTLDLKALNIDRDGFSDQVMLKAAPDMAKLGVEIISCNIQNVSDKEGLIYSLGADNTVKIKKDAAIAKALAEKAIVIEQSKARKEANDASIEADTAIAIKNNELELKKAELKSEADKKKAYADATYRIEEQERLALLNTKTINAEIEKTRREQELSNERILIKENELKAQVAKVADANKYQTEINAMAELEQRKRNAEAEAYEAEQKAKAIKAQADADMYRMKQEAAGIKAKAEAEAYGVEQNGIAEAKAIELKGLAEAEAMDKKAEAYKKYNKAAMAEMLVNVLPQVAEQLAKPMSAIDKVNIYGSDASGMTTLSGNVPVMIKQCFDTVSEATGVDLSDIVKSNTIQAKTNRNIEGNIVANVDIE